MMTKRMTVGLLAVGIGLAWLDFAVGACAETIIVEKPMPAPIVETMPPPRAGFAWVPGHWVFRGRAWFWMKGHYVAGVVPPMPAVIAEVRPPAPTPSYLWVKGHWAWEVGHWAWHRGVWIAP